MFTSITDKLQVSHLRYLCAGVWNTVFGYLVGILIFKVFENSLSIIFICILANILSISMSFATYKIFVFQTDGNWIQEYFRSYLVYGGMAIFSIIFLEILVGQLHFSIWLAQALIIIVGVLISYLGHKNFTFKQDSN